MNLILTALFEVFYPFYLLSLSSNISPTHTQKKNSKKPVKKEKPAKAKAKAKSPAKAANAAAAADIFDLSMFGGGDSSPAPAAETPAPTTNGGGDIDILGDLFGGGGGAATASSPAPAASGGGGGAMDFLDFGAPPAANVVTPAGSVVFEKNGLKVFFNVVRRPVSLWAGGWGLGAGGWGLGAGWGLAEG